MASTEELERVVSTLTRGVVSTITDELTATP